MPAPRFLQTAYQQDQLQIIQFGGLPVPVTGIGLPWINLNDRVAWYAVDTPVIDNHHIINKVSPLAWRGHGVWTSQDFTGRRIQIPLVYDETCGVPFSQAKAMLTQSGEQYLTFDTYNGIRVRADSFSESKFLTGFPEQLGQYLHSTELVFLSRNPFMQGINAQSMAPIPISSNNPNHATVFTMAYYGQALTSPLFTISINGGTGSLKAISIRNNNSQEQIFANFNPALKSGGGHGIKVDSQGQQIVIDITPWAPVGSFPNLYPGFPPPINNTFVVYLIPASGTVTGSIQASWYDQYEI